MPYDILGAEDILAGLNVLSGDGLSETGDDWLGTQLSGAGADLAILAGAAAPAAPATVQAAVARHLAQQHARQAAGVRNATRELAMRHAQAVVPRDYTRGRKLWQGIGSNPQDANNGGPTAVPAGASFTFQAQPQIPFKPDRFFVMSALSANNFLITDVKVGQQSMFASSNGVPASVFAENSVDSVINFDTAQISQQLIVAVVNISTSTAPFFAAFRGFAAL
jgi:hypothetical protein